MVFQKIKGWFDNHDQEVYRLIHRPVLIDSSAQKYLESIDYSNVPKEQARGIYQDGDRWVVFDNSGGGIFVEDFENETLAYAWLLRIEWGYFKQPNVGWIAFHTPDVIPEHKVFKTQREARDFVNENKEE